MGESLELEVERYEFLRLCSIDLNSARHILRLLKRYHRTDTRYALLLAFVITYARPFRDGRGTLRPAYRCPEKGIVPAHLRLLHNEMIARRDRQLAHTDHTFREPTLSRWNLPGRSMMIMGFRNDNLQQLDRQIPQLAELVSTVEANLNAMLAEMDERLQARIESVK